MNKRMLAAIAFVVLNFGSSIQCLAASDESAKETAPKETALKETAKDWQTKSLKGISFIKYGVVYDPDNKLSKTVTSSLSGIGVTLKSVNVKEDAETPLSAKEARLKVVVNERDKNKSWVGLFVQQQSKLDRDPSITYDAETYKIGTLCDSENADSAVKDLCGQFVRDFNRNKGK
jgi:hypothetical protein